MKKSLPRKVVLLGIKPQNQYKLLILLNAHIFVYVFIYIYIYINTHMYIKYYCSM